MVKRKCPNCGEWNYSAAAEQEYWECWNCRAKIPKNEEAHYIDE